VHGLENLGFESRRRIILFYFIPELPGRLWYPTSLLLIGSLGVSWESNGQGLGLNAVPVLMKHVVGKKWHRYRVFLVLSLSEYTYVGFA
jgi:hypothetical protein